MSALRRTLTAVLFVSLAASSLAACGKESTGGTAAKNIKTLPPDLVKGPILGLAVTREDVEKDVTQQDEGHSYIESIGLFSLRDGERLEATLQASKFSGEARPRDGAFRNQVATQIGGSKAQRFRMGDRDVYRSSGRKQSIATWFTDDYYFILSVREGYPTPRTLLRKLLTEVDPK